MSTTVAPEGRKLLRVEARNAQTPIESKPDWLRTRAVVSDTYQEVRGLVREKSLHTVCAEANCPNIYECWNDREATFLVGGEMCTRRCDFCDIATGRPTEYDVDEPRRVAVSIKEMELRYATVTGVARDDRPDGGAWLYAETARQVHELSPGTGVELLIPDFRGNPEALEDVFSSRPEVLGHNLETVPRIFKRIRPAFSYQGSLDVITAAAEAGLVTSPTSSWAWARPATRSRRPWPPWWRRAATSSPSRSTCAPPSFTTLLTAGSSPRSLST